ncbi:MAG: response regulator transcription factor [Sandaracinaceae bacterium]|nr:response regulator transcription factor [Sandaracinaceae bacterium]
MSRRVLVVDDEVRIREVVQYALEREGFRVSAVEDGAKAVDTLARGGFDLVVLDVMMPGADGLEVCRRVRATSKVPILFLSARADEIDRVLGLELGGDDYLVKPFSPRELVARVRAVLRRIEAKDEPAEPKRKKLVHGKITVDPERHEVFWVDAPITLTPTELGLLAALLERPGIVLSRGQLMQRAYSYDNLVTERTIDTHVRRIRAKFRAAGGDDPIATVHGVGYKAAEA